MIPREIGREHVLMAIKEVNEGGVRLGRSAKRYFLEFEGKRYPVKYVVSLACKYAIGDELDPSSFVPSEAASLLKRLGFKVVKVEERRERPQRSLPVGSQGEVEVINISSITLEWSPWYHWKDLLKPSRISGIKVPEGKGVYEVKHLGSDERLTIGKASNLRMRVKQGLVKGKIPHPAGEKIRSRESIDDLLVRWALTNRPSAVEEELHRRHIAKFGRLPKYVEHT